MQEIIYQYIQETKPNEIDTLAYLLEKAESVILADKDFQTWVTQKKTDLAAQRTPQALEAQKESIRQRIIEQEAKFNIGAKSAQGRN